MLRGLLLSVCLGWLMIGQVNGQLSAPALKQALKQAQTAAAKQELALQLAAAYENDAQDSLLLYASLARELATENQDGEGQLDALLWLMQAHLQQLDVAAALALLPQIKPLLAANATPDRQLWYQTFLGWAQLQHQEPEASAATFQLVEETILPQVLDPAAKARFYYYASGLGLMGNIVAAKQKADLAYEQAEASSNVVWRTRSLVRLAELTLRQSDFLKTLKYLQQAEEQATQGLNQYVMAQVYGLRGYVLIRQSVLDSALMYIELAKAAAEGSGHIAMQAYSTQILGDYYTVQGAFTTAKPYYLSVSLPELEQPTLGGYRSLLKLGTIYLATGRIDSTFWWFDQAAEIGKKFGDLDMLGTLGLTKAELYKRMQQLGPAEVASQEAITYFAQTQDTTRQLLAQLGAGRIAFAQGKLPETLGYLDVIFDITQTYQWDDRALPETYLLKAKTDSALGNYTEAIRAMRQYADLIDTFSTRTFRKEVAASETRFRTQEVEARNEILRQKEQATRQRLNLTLVIVAILLLAGGIIGWLAFRVYQQRAALQRANDTKDRLFGMLAHDLRGPVSGFQNMGRIFQHFIRKGQTEQLEAVGQQVDQQASQLSRLLDNLLIWSLQEQGLYQPKTEKVNVESIFEEVIDLHQQSAKTKQIILEATAAPELDVYADRRGLLLALNNLVANAVKFTEEGAVSLIARADDEGVKLEVVDTGIGMSESQRQNILNGDKLSTTVGTAGEKGTGLGMRLVHDLVDSSQGSLTIESQKGQGTRIQILLPNRAA